MQPDINSKEWKAQRRKLITQAKREKLKRKTIPPLPSRLQNYCPICHRHNVTLTKHHYMSKKFRLRRFQWVCKQCHEIHNKFKGPYGKIVNDYYKNI